MSTACIQSRPLSGERLDLYLLRYSQHCLLPQPEIADLLRS